MRCSAITINGKRCRKHSKYITCGNHGLLSERFPLEVSSLILNNLNVIDLVHYSEVDVALEPEIKRIIHKKIKEDEILFKLHIIYDMNEKNEKEVDRALIEGRNNSNIAEELIYMSKTSVGRMVNKFLSYNMRYMIDLKGEILFFPTLTKAKRYRKYSECTILKFPFNENICEIHKLF